MKQRWHGRFMITCGLCLSQFTMPRVIANQMFEDENYCEHFEVCCPKCQSWVMALSLNKQRLDFLRNNGAMYGKN